MTRRDRIRLLAMALVAVVLVLAVSCRSSKPQATTTPQGTGTGTALSATDVGVTATEIKIGQHAPKTGAYAGYYAITQGTRAYFDYVNAELGGVNGRKIVFIDRDDQTNPSVARAVVQQMIEQDKVFAFDGNLGTPQHSAVADYINEQKVPDMYVFTGAGKWNNPQKLPYTFGWTFDYPTESHVLATYAKQNFAGKKIAILYQNDDFGKDYLNTFGDLVKGSMTVVGQQSYETASSDIASQMTALKNSGAEVLAIFAVPKFTVLAYKFMRDSGWHPQVILTSVSADPTVVAGAGADIMEGTITAGYLPDISDDTNAAVKFHKAMMAKYAQGVQASNFTLSGWANAMLMVETLKRAGPNLTRQGLLKTAESIRDFKAADFPPLGPVTMTAQDHSPLHCEKPMKVQGGKFVLFGELICAPVKGLQ